MENDKYKLLLVDDEEEVRKGVLKKINWESHGFQIVGEAENGKEALEIVEKMVPDVVITDIKMPFMDGLELTKNIKEKFPTIKVVILTGFDEFEYAHKAIKFNITEYILKPISAQELEEVLNRIKNQIDKEMAEKKDILSLRENYRRSIPILREKFLTSLITNTLGKDEIKEKSQNYNVNLDGKYFLISIINPDINIGLTDEIEEPNNLTKSQSNLNEERELLKFAILNIVDEIVIRNGLGTVFLNNDQVVIISTYKGEESDGILNTTFKILEEIRQTIEKFMKFTVTIGVGNVVQELSILNRSYKSANDALDYRFFMGNNRIIWIQDIEPQNVDRLVFDEQKEHALVSTIKVGTSNEIYKILDDLFDEISEHKALFKDYQIFLMEMLTAILKAARSSGVEIGSIFGVDYNLFVELNNLKTVKEVREWFKEITIKIMNFIVKDRQNTCQLLVKKAKDYVQLNYADCDITVNKVCDYLHLSPTYFSFIFKRETKTTFINYLTQIRMEIAKELLRTTNMKAFEIAEKIGYSEPNYFSYSFKKRFGISPSEFRNNIK